MTDLETHNVHYLTVSLIGESLRQQLHRHDSLEGTAARQTLRFEFQLPVAGGSEGCGIGQLRTGADRRLISLLNISKELCLSRIAEERASGPAEYCRARADLKDDMAA